MKISASKRRKGVKSRKRPPEPGEAVRELAQKILDVILPPAFRTSQPDMVDETIKDIENVLTEALAPLLEKARHAEQQLYNAAYKDEQYHHRASNEFGRELTRWERKAKP